jgi:hypothetical protein
VGRFILNESVQQAAPENIQFPGSVVAPYSSELFSNIQILLRAGYITAKKVRDLGVGNGVASFDLSFPYKVDGRYIRKEGNQLFVYYSDWANAKGRVVRDEGAKSVRGGWQGAIGYIEITGVGCAEVPPGMNKICGNDKLPSIPYRALFRQDPFGTQWTLLEWDAYNASLQKFLTDRVLDRLQQE